MKDFYTRMLESFRKINRDIEVKYGRVLTRLEWENSENLFRVIIDAYQIGREDERNKTGFWKRLFR